MEELSEDRIQQEIVKWFNNNYCLVHHKPRGIIFSVPNGGRRTKREATKLKATGLLSGVSDLVIIYNGKILFLELKTKEGSQRKTQKDFGERVKENFFEYHVSHSIDEAKEYISHWFELDVK